MNREVNIKRRKLKKFGWKVFDVKWTEKVKARQWCKVNASDDWTTGVTTETRPFRRDFYVAFKSEEDAMLWKLTNA